MSKGQAFFRLIFWLIAVCIPIPVVYFICDKGSWPFILLLYITTMFLLLKIISVIDSYYSDKQKNIKWKFSITNTVSGEVGGTFIYFIFWMILCYFRYVKFKELPQNPCIIENTYRYFIQVCMDALVTGLTILQLNIKEMFIRTNGK